MATNFVSLTIVKKKLLKFIHIYFAKIGFSFFSKVAMRVEMIFQKTFIEKNIKKNVNPFGEANYGFREKFNEYFLNHKLTNLYDVYQLKLTIIGNHLNVAQSQRVFKIKTKCVGQ